MALIEKALSGSALRVMESVYRNKRFQPMREDRGGGG